ncbi:MAG: DegV family protein [Chitinophagales bacterium]
MIRVVTDTTSSFTLEDYARYGITGVPLYVREGDQAVRELFDLSYDDFYRRQRGGSRFATAQPEPAAFMEVFRGALKAGDEVVCVLLSSRISGTVNSARLATQLLETDRVSVCDSAMSGFGQGMLARKAVELAAAGASRAEIVQALEDQKTRTRTYFMVESLKYLYEGGRLSGAAALIGSLIQLKPIIWFDAEGSMGALEKVRTLKAAKARLLELCKERAELGVERAALHYGDNLEEAREFAAEMEALLGVEVPLVQLSPVLGSHTGPDILGPCIVTAR